MKVFIYGDEPHGPLPTEALELDRENRYQLSVLQGILLGHYTDGAGGIGPDFMYMAHELVGELQF